MKRLGIVQRANICGKISILTENLGDLPEEQRKVYLTLSKEIENKRQELCREFPELIAGLLVPFHLYENMPWSEIFSNYPEVLTSTETSTQISRTKILEYILELHPENWSAIFWMMQYERINSELLMEVLTNSFEKAQQKKNEQQRIAAALKLERTKIASRGGKAKNSKIEDCRIEFLKLVEEHSPPFEKSINGISEAVLKFKAEIVQYAREKQNSVITANTGKPREWLYEHWNIKKRNYQKKTN